MTWKTRALLLLFPLAACAADETPDGGTPRTDAGVAVDAGPVACESWLVEYDLAGSEFELRNTPFGAGDAVNVVGPGNVVLRFEGDEAGPKAGTVSMVDYLLELDFTVNDVVTDITVTAGPSDCGVAEGTLTSSVVAWTSPVRGYHSRGTVTCNASELVCGFAGLPHMEASPRDSTRDQAFMPFVFTSSASVEAFTMAEVEIPNDDASDTFLRLTGNERTRRCVPRPACAR